MEHIKTENISKFVVGIAYDRIPEPAVKVARNAILDWLGVTIAGSKELATRIVARQVKQMRATAEATAICNGFRTSADAAAWINGVASHVLDYDDAFPNSTGWNFHPSVPVVPAVLALGEKHRVSGKDIITAYVAGVEVESRVGASMGWQCSETGWHTTPVIGTIGATAASCRIMNLGAAQIANALGIAASLAGGLRRNFGTMTKSLHAGSAARNGVLAAQLAGDGFTASDSILEGENGFPDMFSGGEVDHLTDDASPDTNWRVVSPGISFKPYPCCRATHAAIDAVMELRNRYSIDPDRVTRIVCKTSPMNTLLAKFHRPTTGVEGKFSIPYCIALALIQGRVSLADFTDEKVNEAKAQTLLAKVEFAPPEKPSDKLDLTHEIEIRLDSGAVYSHRVELPKGEPENPMTDAELAAKFRDCAAPYLSRQKIDRVLPMIAALQELPDLSELLRIVA